jgi:hypothetical protein
MPSAAPLLANTYMRQFVLGWKMFGLRPSSHALTNTIKT